jgi:hypothetical protein
MKKIIFLFMVFFSVTLFYKPLNAHPGNTASDGCHYCRTNCASWGVNYDERHCHQSKGVPQQTEPVRSTYGDNGTGFTKPAPEYSVSKSQNQSVEKIQTLKNIEPIDITPIILEKKEPRKTWFGRFLQSIFN